MAIIKKTEATEEDVGKLEPSYTGSAGTLESHWFLK